MLKNCPLPAEVLSLGTEAINQLWREKKIRAVGIKRANALIETAKTSVGVKNGTNAARFEMSMLIEDYLRTQGQIAKCSRIYWSNAQAGDLAFYADLSHVGIVVGKDAE